MVYYHLHSADPQEEEGGPPDVHPTNQQEDVQARGRSVRSPCTPRGRHCITDACVMMRGVVCRLIN